MPTANHVLPAGTWPRQSRRDQVTLAFNDRYRRRIRLVADGGLDFLLDLAEARVLKDGDGLILDDGGIVAVRAAEEDLVEIKAADAGALARLAWHIGNRHLPAAIGPERILIRDDHVIVDMLRGLGATVRAVRAPFDPEGGAYGQHNHDHRHPHRHSDVQGHGHD
jgi:urease accessory protein